MNSITQLYTLSYHFKHTRSDIEGPIIVVFRHSYILYYAFCIEVISGASGYELHNIFIKQRGFLFLLMYYMKKLVSLNYYFWFNIIRLSTKQIASHHIRCQLFYYIV